MRHEFELYLWVLIVQHSTIFVFFFVCFLFLIIVFMFIFLDELRQSMSILQKEINQQWIEDDTYICPGTKKIHPFAPKGTHASQL